MIQNNYTNSNRTISYLNINEDKEYDKSLLGKTYIQCPFNPEHIFKKSIMNIHIHECEDNEQEKDLEEKVNKIQPIRPKKNIQSNNDKEIENINDTYNKKEKKQEKENEN